MARYIIPGFRKIETSGGGGEGGTTNYNDLTNKPFINNVPLVGNLNTVNLKLTDATLTEEGVPAEAKTVGSKLNELEGKYAKKDLYDDTTINVGRKADTEIGRNSTAEGYSTTASGYCSHTEGYSTTASGVYSHAEGYMTTAEANSHAEGFTTTASGGCSHAEGYGTTASGVCSHAEGDSTTASGDYSHAEGKGTNASSYLQHVQGKYNIEDTESKYVHIVGNGTSETERSNAHTVDWEGNAWYSGDVCNGNGVSLDGLNTNMSDVWNNSITYNVNSYCIYNNKLWKCKVQHKNQPPTEGTYWTACTISGEISELNSNLGALISNTDISKTVENNVSTIVRSVELTPGSYILKGTVRFSLNTEEYLRAIGFETRDSLQYPITSYKNCEAIYSKDTITLNVFEFVKITKTTTYNLFAFQNSGASITTEYNLINAIRVSI